MRVIRRLLLALVLAPASTAAFAQAYPSKPIRVIVPCPAGGTMDTLIRLLGPEVTKNLGQPLVVESKPGASSVIGVDAAAKAKPDGYTFGADICQGCPRTLLLPISPTAHGYHLEEVSSENTHLLRSRDSSGLSRGTVLDPASDPAYSSLLRSAASRVRH